MPIIFDGPEQAEINLLIDKKLAALTGVKGTRKAKGVGVSRLKSRSLGPNVRSASLSGGTSFAEHRKRNFAKLSTRSLNRMMGQMLSRTGLNPVGNIFASGPAAITSSIVTGTVAFGNAAMNTTLDAIDARKQARGMFDIPNLPSFSDIGSAAADGRMEDAFQSLVVKASFGKRGLGGAIAALAALTKGLVNRNSWSRSLQDAQQDLWRNQPIPHIDVINAQLTMRNRFERNFTEGGNQYGGWKEAPSSGN